MATPLLCCLMCCPKPSVSSTVASLILLPIRVTPVALGKKDNNIIKSKLTSLVPSLLKHKIVSLTTSSGFNVKVLPMFENKRKMIVKFTTIHLPNIPQYTERSDRMVNLKFKQFVHFSFEFPREPLPDLQRCGY